MRNPSFLKKLQSQIESLPPEIIERVNRGNGLCVSDVFDLALNPKNFSVDFYTPVEPPSLESPVPAVTLKNLGVVLYTEKISDLSRSDVREIFSSGFPIWISCPPSILQDVIEVCPANKVLIQNEFITLTPDNCLISTDENCLHTCGPGDAIASLTDNEDFKLFSSNSENSIYLIDLSVSKCFIDETLLNFHSSGANVTVPVMPSVNHDKSSVLCSVNGTSQLLERFLFLDPPEEFDHTHAGHIIFRANLKLDMIRWSWHRRKVIVDAAVQVHHKRYLYDITEAYDAKFVKVPRELYTLT